jgi:hypothetical protein
MELLIVIVGVVLMWKFSSVLNALSKAGRVKAEVICEEVIAESVIDRTELLESFKAELGDRDITSHAEIMKLFKMEK